MRSKRSVYRDSTTTMEPVEVLKMVYTAWQLGGGNPADLHPLKSKADAKALQYASAISLMYMAALRIGELVVLMADQFSWDVTPAGSPILVVKDICVEKSGGTKARNCPLPMEDPLTVVVSTYVRLCKERKEEFLFDITDRTVRNICYRVSEKKAWPHWYRSQRVSVLSSYLTDTELDTFAGWGPSTLHKDGSFKFPRSPQDFYKHRAWSTYADKVVLASKQHWTEPVDPAIKAWLNALQGDVCTERPGSPGLGQVEAF